MVYLEKLQADQTLRDVAHILHVQPSTVSYLLYILPAAEKYHSFEIPKRNGGKRLINAPESRLKMLQRRLAKVLYGCVAEIKETDRPRRPLAHGFAKYHSIFTNASVHKNRRYVLNLDLEDFFPSFNFGRVRGFFIKDKHFELNEKVATVIAQIACHKNELPQGSPCSPVISNLLGHLLDVRLVRLAKKNKCTYSRYADDITFSTNRKDFPAALAEPITEKPANWQLGAPLVKEIEDAGFKVNVDKTRMQWRGSRQVTTGLIVNKKVNIRSEYYRTVRAICHNLFSTGSYYVSDPNSPVESLNKIEGILSYIHHIKKKADPRPKKEKEKTPLAIRKLYKRFLFYKYFVALEKPLIVTEGKTDIIYLRLAMTKLTEYHPRLGTFVGNKFSSAVRFLKHSGTIDEILQLSGTGKLKKFIKTYKNEVDLYWAKWKNYRNSLSSDHFSYPVIILIDNDAGARTVFNEIKNDFQCEISHESSEAFYHLHANLYLVKTPESGENGYSSIENLFDPELLKTPINGKVFDPSLANNGDSGTYGKIIFAEKVVRPNADKIDFYKFKKLLDRIIEVLDDYEKQKPSPADS